MKKLSLVLGLLAIFIIALIVLGFFAYDLNAKLIVAQEQIQENRAGTENSFNYLNNLDECSLAKMVNGMEKGLADYRLVEVAKHSDMISEFVVLLPDCKRNIVSDVSSIVNPESQTHINLTKLIFKMNNEAKAIAYFQVLDGNQEISQNVGIVDFADRTYTSIYSQSDYSQYVAPNVIGFNHELKFPTDSNRSETILWEIDTLDFTICEDEAIRADAADSTVADSLALENCINRGKADYQRACNNVLKPGIYEYNMSTGKSSLMVPRECAKNP